MIEPIEAEMANPPIFTNAQERVLANEDIERPGAVSKAAATPDTESTLAAESRRGDPEKGDGKIIVTFEPGAGESPREWGKGTKWYTTFSCSALCLTVALGSSMPTGDLPGMAKTLHVGNEAIFLSITLFVLGFGFGPLLFAPLSEVIGRKPVYAISLGFFFLFTLPSCLAHNIATMLAGRMIAGLAASAPMSNVGGSIADVWSVEERGIPMAIFSMTIFLGPCLGPLFGGWIALKTGQWRWIYWVLFILCGCVFAFTLVMPETLEPVLLRKKAKKLNKEHHTDVYISQHDYVNTQPFWQTMKIALLRPIIMMFMEPLILFMSFYLSFTYSLLYALFFAFPIAFEEIRHWNMGMTGVSFVSIIIGMLIAMACMPYQEVLYKRYGQHGARPEARLYPMMVGAIILPISLFIFAFTSFPGNHWMGPCVAGALFGFCMIIIYISANSYIVDSYSNFAASAIASKTLMRSCVGASVPLWITQMYHNMGFWQAGLTIACISLAILPIPYIFFFKGEAIRKASKRATSA